MKKIKLLEEMVQDEMGKNRQFEYYLLIEEIDMMGLFCEYYGVAVEEKNGDLVEIRGITMKQERIEELITLLSFHKVSPITLGEVVEDWL